MALKVERAFRFSLLVQLEKRMRNCPFGFNQTTDSQEEFLRFLFDMARRDNHSNLTGENKGTLSASFTQPEANLTVFPFSSFARIQSRYSSRGKLAAGEVLIEEARRNTSTHEKEKNKKKKKKKYTDEIILIMQVVRMYAAGVKDSLEL